MLRVPPIEVGPRAARHLLSRFAFGPRPGEIRRVLDQGLESWIEEQLSPDPDPELDSRLRGLTTLSYSTSQVLQDYIVDPRTTGLVLDELFTAKLVRAAHGRNQLQQVLTDFWFNHFNVYLADGFDRYATAAYERDAIRPHVLGKFHDLLAATAGHAAMLYYLDNYLNRADRMVGATTIPGINENYGRELLELHTVGVDAGYSQDDVIHAARAFTGWGVDNLRTGGNFMYRPNDHDRNAKSVFGLSIPAGGGKEDGDKLIAYLATHEKTALYIALRLCERFVADNPAPAVVSRVAQRFLATGGDIAEVMKTIASSPEFWAEAFGPGKVKKPFEYVVSVIRATGAQVTGNRGTAAYLANMGEPMFASAPPTGYSNRGVDWLNPSAQLYRMNFALDLAAGAVVGVTTDARALASAAGASAEDPRALVAAVNDQIFGKGLSSETVAAASAVSPTGTPSVAVRVLGLCLASPEMQTR